MIWGHGANAIGRYFPWDKETCTNCGKKIARLDYPAYFELDRILCGRCQQTRASVQTVKSAPPSKDSAISTEMAEGSLSVSGVTSR